jgi:hypothetical protein
MIETKSNFLSRRQRIFVSFFNERIERNKQETKKSFRKFLRVEGELWGQIQESEMIFMMQERNEKIALKHEQEEIRAEIVSAYFLAGFHPMQFL